jgi:hypothetical protein
MREGRDRNRELLMPTDDTHPDDTDEGVDESSDEPRRDAGAHTPGSASTGGSTPVRRRTVLKTLGLAWTLPAAATAGVDAAADSWSIVALPDTQNYSESSSLISHAQNQVDWVVDNASAENIAFVSHEGDVVDHGSDRTEWERMDGVMDTLDGVVPYAAPPGDHDWAVEEDRSSSTENYREFFGGSRYQGRSWYGGSAPNDLSHYQLFSAGGYDFLHIALEWEAPGTATDPDTPLGWAQSVMDEYPDRPTIVTTHSYLWDGDPPGRTTFVEENSDDGSSGEEIWQEIIEPNPQVFMVLCGNFHEGSGSDDGEYEQVSTNADGLSVYEMLANYQDYPEGGEGWLRLVRFVPGGGSGDSDRIEVRTYSPSLDEYQTDSSSEFGFDLSFADRFTSTASSTESASFQQGADGYDGTADTYLQEASPDANNATATTLNVDSDDPNGTNQDVQALLRFDGVVGSGSEQVPAGANVTAASLTVETTNDGDGASLHRMVQSWSDTDTWEAFGGDGIQADGSEAAADADATTGTVSEGSTSIDVTPSVQAWVDGEANHGWAFLPSGGDGWDFYSAEGSTPPKLTVRYETDSSGDTSVAVSTDAATDVGETSATLNGSLSDLGGASSADVAFEYREAGASSWSTTAAQTLSSTGGFSESVSGLSGGTDYEYRATAEASDGDTSTGSTATFTTSSADVPPTVESYAVSEAGSPNPHAEITAEWTVSDAGGDLASVVVEVFDSEGTLAADARTDVSGSSASGSDEFKIRHADGQTFDVTLTVTDENGATASQTATVTE